MELLKSKGLVAKNDLVKILGNGILKAKLNVTANAFSKTALEAIEKAGGTASKI
jgi:large subunit ribosomal protein L15